MLAAVWLAIGVSSASAAAVVNTIPVGNGARGVSSDGGHVWVANWDDGLRSVRSTRRSGTVVNTIPVGSDPFGVSSDGTHVWVTHWVADGTVSEIDASTGAVVNTIPVGSPGPYAVSSDGTHVWVANLYDGTVSEIQIGTANTVPLPVECPLSSTTVPAGYYVSAVAPAASCGGRLGWMLEVLANGVTECPVSAAVPAGYYVSAVVTDSSCNGLLGWTLKALASGTECPLSSTTVPAGYYVSAVAPAASCGGRLGWMLEVLANGVTERRGPGRVLRLRGRDRQQL